MFNIYIYIYSDKDKEITTTLSVYSIYILYTQRAKT